MEKISLANELQANAYPGRGIVVGRTPDGTKAAIAYFIMGRSENSRNRVFVEEGNYNSYTLWTVKCTKCGTALFRSFTQKSVAMNLWNDRHACVRYGKVMP